MTVSELIAKLQEYPPDMRVFRWDGEYAEISEIHDVYVREGGSVVDGPYVMEAVVAITPFDDGVNR